MSFQQLQKQYRSSKLIAGHPDNHRYSKRQSKMGQFKIINPLVNITMSINNNNNSFIPNMPTAIKNQLQGVQYLTYNAINNIGKTHNPMTIQGNKRTSRFSKRLMAMQKALQMQQNKFNYLETGTMEDQFCINQNDQNQGNYLSMMDQQKHSINMQFALHDNLDHDMDIDMGLDMCGQESCYDTEVDFYSETQIRNINYQEYQSYLNV